MNTKLKLSINMEKMLAMDGLVHVYLFNKENILLSANQRQLCVLQELLDVAPNNMIGSSIYDLLGKDTDTINFVVSENEEVLRTGTTKQFYNEWVANGLFRIDMITVKTPVYDTHGNIAGIFGFSQYINHFCTSQALKLGLTKRETECLYYLLDGKSDGEIAIMLHISKRAVESHIENVKNKLNCFSRSELIFKATHMKLKEIFHDELDDPFEKTLISHSFDQ